MTNLTYRSNTMNIETYIEPDDALVNAVQNVNERRSRLSALIEHGDEQKSVIADLERQLDDLVASSDQSAKRECVHLAGELEEERSILDAMELAIRNSRREVELAKHRVALLANSIIKEAAVKTEPEVKKTLIAALKDFYAFHLACDGLQSIGAAQLELEAMAQDRSLVQGAENRVTLIHRSLRESVAA